ncbi:MAG: DUF4476 domain-containing protein [Bacteroidetes bacterium]|jgi:hypothetical protein|nr:DUF4476 domain-containing protein [Bacteroidota bacterium]
MKKLFLLFTFAIPSFLFAQTTGNLTVFSEDGDPFFLVLNGERQNAKPQTNIRVEELPQPYYSAKIIFADSTIATISKNLQITDFDNKMMDVTYRVKKDKNNKAKIAPYSSIEVKPDFVAPSGMYVHRWGQQGGAGGNNGTTHTTTTTNTTNTVGASVNMPGVSMNVTINDPEMTSTTTTTTTTTSHSSHSSNTTTSSNQSSGSGCNGWAMKQGDFTAAKKSISDASFEDTKLSTAKSIASNNCLSSDQVVAICNLFSFEDSKLAFAKYAYKYTVDPKNYFKVNNVFSFDSSKEELSKFTSGDE